MAALTLVGTKFHHGGRSAKFGLDCVGVAVVSAQIARIKVRDVEGYSRQPNGTLLLYVTEQCDPDVSGPIVVFWLDKRSKAPQHISIMVGDSFVHAWEPAGKVIKEPFNRAWRSRMVGRYTWRV